MNMSAWTTKQSKCVYRIHHTQTHKGTKTQVYSNGLVFLSEHCCLPFTCMWTWLRCSTKTCILIPRRALSLATCLCLFAMLLMYCTGLFHWTGRFGMKIKLDFQFVQTLQSVSVDRCAYFSIFFLLLGSITLVAVIIHLWMETKSIRWHSSFYWKILFAFCDCQCAHSVSECVWYHCRCCAYGKTILPILK